MKIFSKKLGRSFTVVALDDGAIPPPRWSVIRGLVGILVFAPGALVLFFVGALVLPTDSKTVAQQSYSGHAGCIVGNLSNARSLAKLNAGFPAANC